MSVPAGTPAWDGKRGAYPYFSNGVWQGHPVFANGSTFEWINPLISADGQWVNDAPIKGPLKFTNAAPGGKANNGVIITDPLTLQFDNTNGGWLFVMTEIPPQWFTYGLVGSGSGDGKWTVPLNYTAMELPNWAGGGAPRAPDNRYGFKPAKLNGGYYSSGILPHQYLSSNHFGDGIPYIGAFLFRAPDGKWNIAIWMILSSSYYNITYWITVYYTAAESGGPTDDDPRGTYQWNDNAEYPVGMNAGYLLEVAIDAWASAAPTALHQYPASSPYCVMPFPRNVIGNPTTLTIL